ncbi:MAG: coproporphyrinogen III oxidase family protein [Chloroflexi bacterium]|nr:coproporphyrinogen III oxidase family protein [Chloroflexota bacterium]
MVVAGAAARGPRSSIGRYLRAVEAELDLRADALDERFGRARPSLGSLYLGGGTPSLLPAPAVARLVELVRTRFGLAPDAEVTIEANPGPDDRGDAGELRAAGVTRLSIGAQSMNDAELRRLGRRHRMSDTAATVAAARGAGIPSISLDLLYDVPDQSVATFASSLEAALAVAPDHLSLYALTLDDPAAEGLTGPTGDHLPPSPGALRWRAAARAEQDEDRAAAMYELAFTRLAAAGFRGYEISNWARPGHESRHNLAYWRRDPHEAVGPGAHAFDGVERRWNAAHLAAYLGALAPGDGTPPGLPPGAAETPDRRAAAAEQTILALRLDTGVSTDEAATGPLAPHLAWARDAGLLASIGDGRVALTTRGRLLSNELFTKLI